MSLLADSIYTKAQLPHSVVITIYPNLRLFVCFLLRILVVGSRWEDTQVGWGHPRLSSSMLNSKPAEEACEGCDITVIREREAGGASAPPALLRRWLRLEPGPRSL